MAATSVTAAAARVGDLIAAYRLGVDTTWLPSVTEPEHATAPTGA